MNRTVFRAFGVALPLLLTAAAAAQSPDGSLGSFTMTGRGFAVLAPTEIPHRYRLSIQNVSRGNLMHESVVESSGRVTAIRVMRGGASVQLGLDSGDVEVVDGDSGSVTNLWHHGDAPILSISEGWVRLGQTSLLTTVIDREGLVRIVSGSQPIVYTEAHLKTSLVSAGLCSDSWIQGLDADGRASLWRIGQWVDILPEHWAAETFSVLHSSEGESTLAGITRQGQLLWYDPRTSEFGSEQLDRIGSFDLVVTNQGRGLVILQGSDLLEVSLATGVIVDQSRLTNQPLRLLTPRDGSRVAIMGRLHTEFQVITASKLLAEDDSAGTIP